MSPMAVEMEGHMWSPFDYSTAAAHGWSAPPPPPGLMSSDLGLDSSLGHHHLHHPHHHPYAGGLEHDYGDLSLLSGLDSPSFSTYSIKRCQGFVRCDMEIDAEVVGWVIGKNGSTIKDLKNKTGCNMWVDQRALKLTITGPDVRTVEHATKSVEAYVAAAPIKAGAVEAAVTRTLECPPHLLDILGDRATIARIVKETHAQVVVNKKMQKAIIRGGPHAVQMALARVQSIITAPAAEHFKASVADLNNHHASLSELDSDEHHSSSSARSRSSSAVGSPTGSAPASPHSASGRTWSLFSGSAAFGTAGAAALAPTKPSTDSLFTAFPDSADVAAAAAPECNRKAPSSTVPSARRAHRSEHRSHRKEAAAAAAAAAKPEDLNALLTALRLTKYQPAFEENEVDMDAVLLMSEADFSELGVPKGPRLKIMNAVRARAGKQQQQAA